MIESYSENCPGEIQREALSIRICRSLRISTFADLHNLLWDVVQSAQKYFGYTIILALTFDFIVIVFDTYYILELFFEPKSSQTVLQFLGIIVFHLITSSIEMMSIVEICEQTTNQNMEILKSIHELLNMNVSLELEEELHCFAAQCKSRPIKFTAAGMFDLNRTLYLTVS